MGRRLPDTWSSCSSCFSNQPSVNPQSAAGSFGLWQSTLRWQGKLESMLEAGGPLRWSYLQGLTGGAHGYRFHQTAPQSRPN